MHDVENRVTHLGFRHLAGEALDRHDGVIGAGHHEVEVAFLHLAECGKHDELPVDAAEANRPFPR